MKKIVALLLVLTVVLSFAACTGNEDPTTTGKTDPTTTGKADPTTTGGNQTEFDPSEKSEGVMTYEQYMAAELDTEVKIEAFVQAKQGWWEKDGQGVITLYLQDPDGAYLAYEVACSQEDAEKLVPGVKICVTGTKCVWQGETEIMYGTFEFVESDGWIVDARDVTDLLDSEDLINYQNQFVGFKGMSVVLIEYKNGEPGDDIYVTLSLNDKNYSFCVEAYLTGPDTDVYKAVQELKVGDKVDVEGFLYWFQEKMNPHITAISKVTE